jgi:hypothetical protein
MLPYNQCSCSKLVIAPQLPRTWASSCMTAMAVHFTYMHVRSITCASCTGLLYIRDVHLQRHDVCRSTEVQNMLLAHNRPPNRKENTKTDP